jgi:hypothetical protein
MWLLLFTLFHSHDLQAAEKCFSRHLKEAIEVNETRKPLYESATQGKSRNISRTLIGLEKLTLTLFSWRYDRRAKPYQQEGIPLLCDEFVPMNEIPPFAPHLPPPVTSPEKMPALDVREMKERLESALDSEGFEAVERLADEEIQKLEWLPHHFCMSRHVLESVRRSARLAPQHYRAAEARGLESPKEISRDFIRLQLRSLNQGLAIDKESYPLQARGIPIICQDVPKVP